MTARERYLHLLLAVAVIMVVTNDLVDRAWLLMAYPSTAVVFAGSGALAAALLERTGSARAFYRQSVPRLLGPFWLFGAVLVPSMLAAGWRADAGNGAVPLTLRNAWLWLLPVSDPPASTQGVVWTSATWIVQTSLWLLLVTPALLWLFRIWPLRLAAVPVTTLLLLTVGAVNLYGRAYDVVVQLCVDSCFWLLGIAYHDGRLQRIPLPAALAAGAALMGAGTLYGLPRQHLFGLASIYDVPLAALLFGGGGVLVLLRLQPWFTWLAGTPRLVRALAAVSGHKITVLLWADVAVAVTPWLLEHTRLGQYDSSGGGGALLEYSLVWILLFVVVQLTGRLELGEFGSGRSSTDHRKVDRAAPVR